LPVKYLTFGVVAANATALMLAAPIRVAIRTTRFTS
jgi:hypothetical protein